MRTRNLTWLCAGLLTLSGCAPQGGSQTTETTTAENAVIETILARRSIRKYTAQPVEREKLELIVKCGINAPSGLNKQPWEVRVVDDAAYIDGLTALYTKANPKAAEDPNFKNMFRNAPAVIFIASPVDGSGQLDCGLLGENMVLAAQSLGLGSCCLGGPTRFMTDAAEAAPYLEKLGFSEGYKLLYAIGVGYPDEAPDTNCFTPSVWAIRTRLRMPSRVTNRRSASSSNARSEATYPTETDGPFAGPRTLPDRSGSGA